MKRIILIPFLILIPVLLWSDNVRGPLAGEVKFKSDQKEMDVIVFGIEDLITIPLDADPYTNGLLLRIKTPRSYQKFANSYSIHIYKQVYPSPSPSNRYYSGEEIVFEILPMKDEYTILLPFNRTESPQEADIMLSKDMDPVEGPLVLTILPLMKGLPEEAMNIKWTLEGLRFLNNKGGFLPVFSSIRESYQNEVTLNINSDIYYKTDKPVLLKSGEYTLELSSPYHEQWTTKFKVEPGNITKLLLTPKEKQPKVIFDVPDGTTIIIDGEKNTEAEMGEKLLPQGNHSFFFSLGDHQITKTLYLEGGKEYKISIFLDIQVEEAKPIQ